MSKKRSPPGVGDSIMLVLFHNDCAIVQLASIRYLWRYNVRVEADVRLNRSSVSVVSCPDLNMQFNHC